MVTEVVQCKECKHRNIVNECPFARYYQVRNTNYAGHSQTTVSGDYFDSPTRIITFCPVTDEDYCSRGESKYNI